MAKNPSFVLATEFYPLDPSTTASYLGAVADAIALHMAAVVLSGTPGSQTVEGTPAVVEIENWKPKKHRSPGVSSRARRWQYGCSGPFTGRCAGMRS